MVLRKWESRQPPLSEAGINPPIDPGLFFLPPPESTPHTLQPNTHTRHCRTTCAAPGLRWDRGGDGGLKPGAGDRRFIGCGSLSRYTSFHVAFLSSFPFFPLSPLSSNLTWLKLHRRIASYRPCISSTLREKGCSLLCALVGACRQRGALNRPFRMRDATGLKPGAGKRTGLSAPEMKHGLPERMIASLCAWTVESASSGSAECA